MSASRVGLTLCLLALLLLLRTGESAGAADISGTLVRFEASLEEVLPVAGDPDWRRYVFAIDDPAVPADWFFVTSAPRKHGGVNKRVAKDLVSAAPGRTYIVVVDVDRVESLAEGNAPEVEGLPRADGRRLMGELVAVTEEFVLRNLSQRVGAFLFDATDDALTEFRAHPGVEVVLVAATAQGAETQRFDQPDTEKALEAARAAVRSLTPDYTLYAVCYHGVYQPPGKKDNLKVLLLEVAERGAQGGVLMAQPIRVKRAGRIVKKGDPYYVSQMGSLLGD